MKKLNLLFSTLLFCFIFAGCSDQDDSSNNQNQQNDVKFAENFGATVSRNFIGQIVDVNNSPISNVTIAIGTSTVQTDSNGVFIINDASVREKFAYITAKKSGFIDGSRSLVPTSGTNHVKIMMLPQDALQTISSGTTSEVSIYSGTKVVFDGAFQDENGVSYSGAVSVSMFHLTPSEPTISELMPGMLYAQDLSGQQKTLETFGMMNVELRGSNGQKLQIASGHTAQITIRIDDAQMASAPSSMPLWHFDDSLGYWKEEGSVTKQGNYYVGTVTHFSWWNCDAPFSTVTLSMNIVNTANQPLANIRVELVSSNSPYPRTGYSNTQGQVNGLIPANQVLIMTIYSVDICGDTPISTSTIGPFSTDTTLPTIVIDNPQVTSTVVQGTLLKCDNSNVTNGYVLLHYGNQFYPSPVTNGAFSLTMIYCPSNPNFTLQGFNFNDLQTTSTINYTFTSPITNIGTLSTCNSITEFISYQLDSNPLNYIITGITANAGQNQGTTGAGLTISGYGSTTSGQGIYIWGNTNVPGLYTTAQFSIEGSQVGYVGIQSINTIGFNLSQFGAVNEYIDLTFSGTYQDSVGATHTIVGVAHVLRDN